MTFDADINVFPSITLTPQECEFAEDNVDMITYGTGLPAEFAAEYICAQIAFCNIVHIPHPKPGRAIKVGGLNIYTSHSLYLEHKSLFLVDKNVLSMSPDKFPDIYVSMIGQRGNYWCLGYATEGELAHHIGFPIKEWDDPSYGLICVGFDPARLRKLDDNLMTALRLAREMPCASERPVRDIQRPTVWTNPPSIDATA